jgi:hypothetical protein
MATETPPPPRDDLYWVSVRLQAFNDAGDANRVADDIRDTGTVSYTDATGSTVNASVRDITVTSSS